MASEAKDSSRERGPGRFRRADAPRLQPDCARRQGDITRMAFQLLGRDGAIRFLNDDNAELGTRPLDMATASAAGFAQVEAMLIRPRVAPERNL